MAKYRKTTPEEEAAIDERSREFRAMLERRLEVDKRLRVEREARELRRHRRRRVVTRLVALFR